MLDVGRGAVQGLDGDLLDGGTLGAVHIGQPQVQVVISDLLQMHGIHLGHQIGGILLHIHDAVAQIARHRVGLEVGGLGGGGTLGQQRVVHSAILIGHDQRLNDLLAVIAVSNGHGGIAAGKGGGGIVGGGESGDLHRASHPAVIHQNGRDIVGAVGGQAGHLGGEGRVGAGGGERAALENGAAVDGRIHQLILLHRAVGQGGHRPVDGTLLVGLEDQVGGLGGDILRRRIAGEQAGVLGGLLSRHGIHLLLINIGGDAGTHRDGIGEHHGGGTGRVDIHVADIAGAFHLGGGIQIHHAGHGFVVDVQSGADGLLVDGDALGHALRQGDGGAGGQIDHILDIAREVELGAKRAVQGQAGQTVAVVGDILQVGGGADIDLGDVGEALRLQGDKLVGHTIQDQLVGGDITQQNAVFALLALAGAGDHNLTQHAYIFQLHIAQTDAAADIQVTVDHSVLQGDTGGVDGQVAVHAPQAMYARLLDGGADGLGEHHGHLAAGHILLGAEAAVGIAGDDTLLGNRLNHVAAPITELAAVVEAQRLAGAALEHHVLADEHGCLFPGQGIPGCGHGVGHTAEIAHIAGDANVLVKPVGGDHILIGIGADLGVAVGAVDHADKFRTGDVPLRLQIAVDVAAHDAPGHHLVQVGVHPGRGLDVGGGQGKQTANKTDGRHETGGCRLKALYAHVISSISSSSSGWGRLLSCRLNTRSQMSRSSSDCSAANFAA